MWPVDKSLAKTTNYSIPYLSNYSSELWFVEKVKEKGKCAILSLTTISKRTCDLKQNGTQEKASFSGIAFVPLHVMGCVLCRVLAPETNF